MSELITMGETMAAFTPGSQGPLRYVMDYHLRTAGAESNVAVGAAKLGISVSWFSRLGEDEFGHYVCNQIRGEGVDCSHVIFDLEHPTGVMFKENGASETKVFYYRKNSAASCLNPDDIPPTLFEGAKIFHISGITPILSESCRCAVEASVRTAREKGLNISFDPNIRRKLWGETDHSDYLRRMMFQSEILLLGIDEAEALLGLNNPQEIAKRLFEAEAVQYVAIKSGAQGAYVADRDSFHFIHPFPCCSVDPIGAGDGFDAGFLAGLLQGHDVKKAGQMGGICGALATEVNGDTEGYPDHLRMEQLLSGDEIIYR